MIFLVFGTIKKTGILLVVLMSMLSYVRADLNVDWSGPGTLLVSAPNGKIHYNPGLEACGIPRKKIYFYKYYKKLRASKYTLEYLDRQRPYVTVALELGNCGQLLMSILPVSITIPIDARFTAILLSDIPIAEGDYMALGMHGWSKGQGTGTGWEPPAPAKPTCTGHAVTLNYTDIEANKVQGREKTENLSIRCTGDTSVRVYTKSDNIDLRSDNTLNASLFVGGSVGTTGSTVTVAKDTPMEVAITSKLNFLGVGNPPGGPFNGSAVIYMEIG